MSVANNSPINTRAVIDYQCVTNVPALPNAGNTVTTNFIDLRVASPWPTINRVLAQIVTTLGNGANNKNINAVWQHCDDNGSNGPDSANAANIPYLGAPILTLTDANGAGYAASVAASVQLPPGTKRWIRVSATGEANGGNAANGTIRGQLAF